MTKNNDAMKKRILFIDGDYKLQDGKKLDYGLPIALLDMAPYLRKFGYDVHCTTMNKAAGVEGHFDYVGYSTLGAPMDVAIERCRDLVRQFPQSQVILGGKVSHCFDEAGMKRLHNEGAELCTGWGEHFFTNQQEVEFENYPSWQRVDFETLGVDRKTRWCNVMTSRGCPYRCNFCHNTERKVHYFNEDRVADNIGLLLDMGREYIHIVDDIFTLDAERMRRIYNTLKRRRIPIENRVRFFSHINHINSESIKAMKLYQPIRVSVGVESGDDKMLELMDKCTNYKRIVKRLSMLAGEVKLQVLLLIGFPGETKESLQKTLALAKLVKKWGAINTVSLYQPIPKTVGYEMALEHGEILCSSIDNKKLSYLDRNLTAEMLLDYRQRILVA
jgi:radical SAM superfamily enzyme YgiQ (UPF0313 family)